MTATARPAARPVGRPRSAEADRAILDATLEVFVELGLDGLTVEGVAARAGVGKGTIYRRYPSKIELVMAATHAVVAARSPAPDTGWVARDLRILARGLVEILRSEAGAAIAQMVADKRRNPDLAAAHRAFVEGRRKISFDAVRRGIDRGELRRDTDAAVVTDAIAGPLFYRQLVTGERIDRRFADRLVDEVLAQHAVTQRRTR